VGLSAARSTRRALDCGSLCALADLPIEIGFATMTEAFGPTLRRLRLGRGHSLRELASMINYSAAYLSELERGKRPTMQVARRCDDALGGAGVLLALVAPRGTRATTGSAEPYGPLWPAGGGVADLGPELFDQLDVGACRTADEAG
jgi:transcriptional regulator with XRE-family HTH domain